MKQEIIQKESKQSHFFEFDDDGSDYKSCNNCGQGQYPHKHGICHICGTGNWTINFEKKRIYKIEKLGIVELVDN